MLHQGIKIKSRTAVPVGAAFFMPNRQGALKKALNTAPCTSLELGDTPRIRRCYALRYRKAQGL